MSRNRHRLECDLRVAYSIKSVDNKCSINGIPLTFSHHQQRISTLQVGDQREEETAAGIGHCCHLLKLIAYYLDIPLVYPLVAMGSTSHVINPFKAADGENRYTLYNGDPVQFRVGKVFLGRDILQMFLNVSGKLKLHLPQNKQQHDSLDLLNSFLQYSAEFCKEPF